jgi:hypothetical protein
MIGEIELFFAIDVEKVFDALVTGTHFELPSADVIHVAPRQSTSLSALRGNGVLGIPQTSY